MTARLLPQITQQVKQALQEASIGVDVGTLSRHVLVVFYPFCNFH
jgi:hypothetical protein